MLVQRLRQHSGLARFGLPQRGDTIVEVLLAIAIVSFVLVAAYVTANKNTLINQDTQERSQALQLATTQLEFLRSSTISTNNCFSAAGVAVGTGAVTAPANAPCIVGADGQPAGTGVQPAYTLTIVKGAGVNYRVDVTWDSLISKRDHITLYYQP